MDDSSREAKLRLVRQVRNQYHQNQYDLSNREQILYGRQPESAFSDTNMPESVRPYTTLRLRTAIAVILLLAVILFDRFGIRPGGMQMKELFALLSEDYQENVDAFVNALSEESISDLPAP